MSKIILLVDDETVVLEIAKRRLEELGYEVMAAQDGAEGLSFMRSKIPDLIFLDVQMPGMNGYTFLMEKNKVPEWENVPVVVLTAYNETEPLFKRHGARAYLLKPLKLQDLISKAAELIGKP